ncbi:MAG: FKBP-type peptidyl-prolyl cis-trans isomerase [Flavobacteriales bacterium]|jgi:FKBP-type peptidyl-prolyl cis-trans isomerase
MRINYLVLLIGIVLLSCNGCKEKKQYSPTEAVSVEDQLIQANRNRLQEEQNEILAYIVEMKWDMLQTSTGLHYEIYEEGSGKFCEDGRVAVMDYSSALLDGTACYSSEVDGQKIFRVGLSEAESGLHELAPLLRKGDKVRVILPSHRAYGFTGDRVRIPPNSILVYDIQLVDVQ